MGCGSSTCATTCKGTGLPYVTAETDNPCPVTSWTCNNDGNLFGSKCYKELSSCSGVWSIYSTKYRKRYKKCNASYSYSAETTETVYEDCTSSVTTTLPDCTSSNAGTTYVTSCVQKTE